MSTVPTTDEDSKELTGASLFWEPIDGDHVAIMAGTLDGPTGLQAAEHIFVDYAGDYYSLEDGLAQHGDYGPKTWHQVLE